MAIQIIRHSIYGNTYYQEKKRFSLYVSLLISFP